MSKHAKPDIPLVQVDIRDCGTPAVAMRRLPKEGADIGCDNKDPIHVMYAVDNSTATGRGSPDL